MSIWNLPPNFDCVICRREQVQQHWFGAMERKPPVCRSCIIHRGNLVRVAGMSRGDHVQLNKIAALADELKWEASAHGR